MKAHLQLPKGWHKLQRYERVRAGDRPMYADGSVSKTRVRKNAPEVGMTVAASGWFNVARKESDPYLLAQRRRES